MYERLGSGYGKLLTVLSPKCCKCKTKAICSLPFMQMIVQYRISGNFGAMEILALLADDKNTPN